MSKLKSKAIESRYDLPRRAHGKIMHSLFPSRCIDCHSEISAGDDIFWNGAGAEHLTCFHRREDADKLAERYEEQALHRKLDKMRARTYAAMRKLQSS